MEYTHKDFTDNGRIGYRDSDYNLIPRRKVWPTEDAAVSSMSGNYVAFRVYKENDPKSSNPFSVSVLADYVVIERTRKGKPYVKTLKSCLASCHAEASDILGDDTELRKVIALRDWWRIQSSQHIKAIGL